jgi:hypothetical protein
MQNQNELQKTSSAPPPNLSPVSQTEPYSARRSSTFHYSYRGLTNGAQSELILQTTAIMPYVVPQGAITTVTESVTLASDMSAINFPSQNDVENVNKQSLPHPKFQPQPDFGYYMTGTFTTVCYLIIDANGSYGQVKLAIQKQSAEKVSSYVSS